MKWAKSVLMGCCVVLMMSGCNKKAPECSDDKAKELVIQIAYDKALKGGGENLANNLTFELESIRTTGQNDETGSFECAGDLNFVNTNGTTGTFPITYKTELVDDGEGVYVTVFGL